MRIIAAIQSLVAALALLVFLPPPVSAEDDTNTVGAVNADGYSYSDGFYWRDSLPYTREWIAGTAGYYTRVCSYGCAYLQWVPGTAGYYRYSRAACAKVTSASPDWRAQLLSIAQQRDKYELKSRAAVIEQANFERSVQALGLTGNFRVEGYGAAVAYPQLASYGTYGVQALGAYGVTGNTRYGYSLKTVTDAYGQADPNALYQAAAQGMARAQDLAGQAQTAHTGLVGQAATNAYRIAEMYAKIEAMKAAAIGSTPQPQTHTTTTVQAAGSSPVALPPPAPTMPQADQAPNALWDAWRAAANTQGCVQCHTTGADAAGKPVTASGGFNVLLDYPKMGSQDRLKVLAVLVTADESKRMPKGKPALSMPQLDAWIKTAMLPPGK